MKKTSLLAFPWAAILSAAILIQGTASAQTNIIWNAIGLPGGLSMNPTTGVISGIPTVGGNFQTVVYPQVGSSIGEMVYVPITVMPSNVILSTYSYYPYTRIYTNGDVIHALAGGGGMIACYDPAKNIPLFTTNGTTFITSIFPVKTTGGQATTQAGQVAIAGNIAASFTFDVNGIAYFITSTNQGPFQISTLPPTGYFTNNNPTTTIASDGTNYFYAGLGDGSVWRTPSKAISWKQIATISNINVNNNGDNSPFSVAVSGNTVLLCIAQPGSNYAQYGLLISTNGGSTFSQSTNSDIYSVAFGNGVFLGSGQSGVYTSTNGVTWSIICPFQVGQIVFSTPQNRFFSTGAGVSGKGANWIPYGGTNGGNYSGTSIVSSGTGVVFLDTFQLVTNSVSKYPNGGSTATTVGTPTTIIQSQ